MLFGLDTLALLIGPEDMGIRGPEATVSRIFVGIVWLVGLAAIVYLWRKGLQRFLQGPAVPLIAVAAPSERDLDTREAIMPARSGWELTPRQSVELECARRGESGVVTGCIALMRGQDVDDGLLFALGGPMASIVIHDNSRQRNQYWRRVWGARGLLYAWMPEAAEAIIAALSDEHWRVREMAAKVIAKRKIGDALHEVTTLREDSVPRVRAAAERAIVVLTAARS